jgi:hypothetical protein
MPSAVGIFALRNIVPELPGVQQGSQQIEENEIVSAFHDGNGMNESLIIDHIKSLSLNNSMKKRVSLVICADHEKDMA